MVIVTHEMSLPATWRTAIFYGSGRIVERVKQKRYLPILSARVPASSSKILMR